VPEGSPWRNEISPAIFLTLAAYRPYRRARQVHVPLWVGMGEPDITTSGTAVEQLATMADHGELHRYPVDHFGPFGDLAMTIAASQVRFLRRAQLVPAADRG
jgi:hypothetical protein